MNFEKISEIIVVLIFTFDFWGNMAIDIGKAKPNDNVHANAFNGKLRRG